MTASVPGATLAGPRNPAADVSESNDLLVCYCTCPDDAVASAIAHALVSEGLAACVNRIGGVRSVYRWQGEVHDDAEVLLMIKIPGSGLDRVRERIESLHPYELPELIAVEIRGGSTPYLAWLRSASAP